MNFHDQRRAALKNAGLRLPIRKNTPPDQEELIRQEVRKIGWIGVDWWAQIMGISIRKLNCIMAKKKKNERENE